MTNKDKVIAAFLVSLGVFSIAQATIYVKSLSGKERTVLVALAKNQSKQVFSPGGVEIFTKLA